MTARAWRSPPPSATQRPSRTNAFVRHGLIILVRGKIDAKTYRARLEERKAYRLHVKQKAKTADGKVMLRCPALSLAPTVTCPLREMMLGAAKKARPEVEPETLEEEFLDTICKKHSAAFDLTEMQAPQQAFDYGSEEWESTTTPATPSSPRTSSSRPPATKTLRPPDDAESAASLQLRCS